MPDNITLQRILNRTVQNLELGRRYEIIRIGSLAYVMKISLKAVEN